MPNHIQQWLLACVGFALAGLVSAQEAVPGANLESLLTYARERNVEYAAMRYDAQAAMERIGPAGALPDPMLRIEWMDITRMGDRNPTLDPSRVGGTRYRLMQELPWFGKRALRADVATFEAEAVRNAAQGSWTELRAATRKSYVQHYYIAHNERVTRDILALLQRLEQLAQVRYGNGLSPQQDAVRAQLEQTALRSDLLMLENERRSVEARLNALLNRPADAPLAEPETLPSLPQQETIAFEALLDRARQSNPQLAVEVSRIHAAEKSRELTYRNRYPDVAFGVAPIQSGDSINEWEVMVEFSIPLQQGTRRSQEREAGAMLAAARARHDAVMYRLTGEIAEQLAAYETAARTESLIASSLLPQSRLTMQSALAGYETGKVDFATLLEAQRAIDRARIDLLKAQAERQLRIAELERLLGVEL